MRYAFGDYLLDTACYELYHMGTRVPLRPKVLEVLAYLVVHRDRVVSKQELLAQLWPDHVVGEEGLKAYIMAVRQALGDRGSTPRLLRTVHGRGYRFVAPVTSGDPARSVEQPPTPRLAVTPELVDSLRLMAPTPAAPDPASPDTVFSVADEEYRLVSVLCCTLTDAPALAARLGPEALYRLMQAVFRLVQEVMQHYEGTITHQTSEGFTAVFGVPAAQEDHARRAVLAALELRQHLGAHAAWREHLPGGSLAVSMGLHSGLVIIGGLGQDPQRPYTVVGEPLYLATRLQRQAAPRTILLSAATYHLVHEEVRGEPGAPLDVDGRPIPVPVYALQDLLQRHAGVPGRSTRAGSPFVGRERELALLHARLAHVTQGQGQVVGLVGEPGIGKSRLLAEFRHSLAEQPVLYRDGHCRPYDRSTPYGPVRDLLRQGCGLSAADGVEAITAKVHRALEEAHLKPEDEAPLLLQLLDVPVDGTQLTHLSPQERQVHTFALLRHLVQHDSQRQPLILAVENLHWIDTTSEAWLTALVEHLADAAILLLVTYRPGYQPPWLAQSVATQVALPRLLPADSRAVVQAVLHSTTLSEPLLQTIVTKAAGNPFFLEELAWTVRDHNSHTALLGVPDTIQAVLAARLDRLSPAEKGLLQTAAVVGHEFPVVLLQAMGELPAETVQQGLRQLQSTELLSETHGFPEPVYTFKHALTHEVAYGSLLQERRRVLHARLVEVLETLPPDRLDEVAAGRSPDQVERLAYHALRGEVWAKAVRYCQQAGARAEARSAYAEAVHAVEQALVALAHLPESPTTLAQAIDMRLALRYPLMALGQYQTLRERMREAESLATLLGDHGRQGWVAVQLALVYRTVADYATALDVGYQALRVATDLGDDRLEVEATFRLGQAYWGTGDFGQALAFLRRSLDAMAKQPDRAAAEAERHGWLAFTLSRLGQFGDALAQAEQALRLAEAYSDVWGRIQASAILGDVFLLQGDLPRATTCLEQSVGLARTWDVPDWGEFAIRSLGTAYMLAGRCAEAILLAEEGLRLTRATGQLDDLTEALCGLGEVYLCAGRLDAAHEQARQALEHARQHIERAYEGRILYLLGAIAARREPAEIAQAHDYYQHALALANALGLHPLQAHCHRSLGTLYATTGRREQAHAELSTAIARYRAMGMTFWLPETEAALAQLTA